MRSLWIYLLVILGTALVFEALHTPSDRIPYARFRDLADAGQIAEVEIQSDAYVARTPPDRATGTARTYRTGRIKEGERDLLARLDQRGVPYTLVAGDHALFGALWLLPVGAAVLILFLGTRKNAGPTLANPALSFGKNKARLYTDKGARVSFADVAGSEEAKTELAEIVEFLKAPERFRRLGAHVPRGVLLVGPPGTGKTLLARAVAGEAGVAFFSCAARSSSRCSSAWARARTRPLRTSQETRACIIFIDELDAIGKARGAAGHRRQRGARADPQPAPRPRWTGSSAGSGLIIMAATNRPEILDPALLRPGRFDRQVVIDRPDMAGAHAILRCTRARSDLAPDVDLGRTAGQTPGSPGRTWPTSSTRRRSSPPVAAPTPWSSETSTRPWSARWPGCRGAARRLGPHERRVAYHEAGHALAAELLPTQDPVRKVSILPRGPGALGYTMPPPPRTAPDEPDGNQRPARRAAQRARRRGNHGRRDSTSAEDDLANATDIARRMVRELGMSRVRGARGASSRGAEGARRAAACRGEGATTATPPPRPSTPRWRGCSARPRSAPAPCSPSTATRSAELPSGCSRPSPSPARSCAPSRARARSGRSSPPARLRGSSWSLAPSCKAAPC